MKIFVKMKILVKNEDISKNENISKNEDISKMKISVKIKQAIGRQGFSYIFSTSCRFVAKCRISTLGYG